MRTEEELMDAYVAGDVRAFEALFRRTAGLVLGTMRRGWLDATECEDLAQEVFLRLHRARFDYQSGRPLRPWLMTIARNLKRDHLRRVGRRAPLLDLEGREPGAEDDAVGRIEAREAVRAALERLPATLRVVVRAHWLEHRSFGQIAEALGISKSAAKVRAHRAYRALREHLRAFGPDGAGACDREGPADVSRGEGS
jgi:RNA polymerase sigma-70 factor (ECF subfamily)